MTYRPCVRGCQASSQWRFPLKRGNLRRGLRPCQYGRARILWYFISLLSDFEKNHKFGGKFGQNGIGKGHHAATIFFIILKWIRTLFCFKIENYGGGMMAFAYAILAKFPAKSRFLKNHFKFSIILLKDKIRRLQWRLTTIETSCLGWVTRPF